MPEKICPLRPAQWSALAIVVQSSLVATDAPARVTSIVTNADAAGKQVSRFDVAGNAIDAHPKRRSATAGLAGTVGIAMGGAALGGIGSGTTNARRAGSVAALTSAGSGCVCRTTGNR
jgi:hypothetical protein